MAATEGKNVGEVTYYLVYMISLRTAFIRSFSSESGRINAVLVGASFRVASFFSAQEKQEMG